MVDPVASRVAIVRLRVYVHRRRLQNARGDYGKPVYGENRGRRRSPDAGIVEMIDTGSLLSQLEPVQCAVLVLIECDGMSRSEVGQAFGWTCRRMRDEYEGALVAWINLLADEGRL